VSRRAAIRQGPGSDFYVSTFSFIATKPASISSGLPTKARKNPTIFPIQQEQRFKRSNVQEVAEFRGDRRRLEAALEQFREFASDLAGDVTSQKDHRQPPNFGVALDSCH